MTARRTPPTPPPAAPDDLFDKAAPPPAAKPPREPGDDSDEVMPPLEEAKTALAVPAPAAPASIEQDGAFISGEKTGLVRRGLDEMEYGKESVAVAAQVKAMMQGRIVQALQRPRSTDDARVAILRECKRTAFAKAAIYKKPVGNQTIEGLSIRFAETALRLWGNVASESIILYDDDTKRTVRILLVDLETNTWHARDITLLKAVERRQLRRGQVSLAQRVNTYGDMVYLVEATEEEISTKEANARSKVLRNEGLRLIPADILDEAKELCKATIRAGIAQDPEAERKALVDAFAELRIMPSDLEQFLGCAPAQASPAQLEDLRTWYRAVRDGEATWQEILSARVNDLAPEPEESAQGGGHVEKLKAKLTKNGKR